jgi:hypothetical protein
MKTNLQLIRESLNEALYSWSESQASSDTAFTHTMEKLLEAMNRLAIEMDRHINPD